MVGGGGARVMVWRFGAVRVCGICVFIFVYDEPNENDKTVYEM